MGLNLLYCLWRYLSKGNSSVVKKLLVRFFSYTVCHAYRELSVTSFLMILYFLETAAFICLLFCILSILNLDCLWKGKIGVRFFFPPFKGSPLLEIRFCSYPLHFVMLGHKLEFL